MGKRSQFERRKNDAYQTPAAAVMPLLPHLRGIRTFAEPCVGEGKLVVSLQSHGLVCLISGDIQTGQDAMTDDRLELTKFDAIITNPPWTREILHPLIKRFQSIAPTWLIFDADWAHTRQAYPFLDQCSHIVSAGRVKWIEDSKFTGKDNAAWYRFHDQHSGGPRFFPSIPKTTLASALVKQREERGSEAHPGNPELQQHYDEYLDAVDLSRSGDTKDMVNVGRAYTKYAKARDTQEIAK